MTQFLNNFSQKTSTSINETDTSFELQEGAAALSGVDQDNPVLLTLFKTEEVDGYIVETAREIVKAVGYTAGVITVERAQEGTTSPTGGWPSGTEVENRVTAGFLNSLSEASDPYVQGSVYGSAPAAGSLVIGAGSGANASDTVRSILLGEGETNGLDSIVLGFDNYPTSGDYVVAIGGSVDTSGDYAFAAGNGASAAASATAIGKDAAAGGANSLASGSLASASAAGASAMGDQSSASAEGATAAGQLSSSSGVNAFAGGKSASAAGDSGVAVGDSASAGWTDSTSVGRSASTSEANATALAAGSSAGKDSTATGHSASAGYQEGPTGYGGAAYGSAAVASLGGVAVGDKSAADAPLGMAVGQGATDNAPEGAAVGQQASVSVPYAVALGPYASADVKGGMQVNAVSYLPATYDDTGTYGGPVPTAARRSASQVVVATDALDLTDDAATVTLDLPSGSMMFVDSIDVVIVESDNPGGTPEITVGPDGATPASYLAATAVGKTAVGGRETHTPLVADGVTSLRVATNTAGTGTTYNAKVVFRGYVMEL